LPLGIKLIYLGSGQPNEGKKQNKTTIYKNNTLNLTTPLKGSPWKPKPRVIKLIGFKTDAFFRHRTKSAPLFLPHKRKANPCLMVNNFWQLLLFKLLQGQDNYLERQIADHLDRRLCHVDRP
jgi:hypothetical protein